MIERRASVRCGSQVDPAQTPSSGDLETMGEIWLMGWLVAAVYFAGVWAICVRVGNYGFLDVAWSYGVAVLAPFYACFSPGEPIRKWSFVVAGALWSLRLGTHVLVRVLKHHPKEDPRYERLREDWPGPARFLLFFELQALIAAVFSLPFLSVCFDTAPWDSFFILGLCIALAGIVGEATADWQMTVFKKSPASHGQVCRVGLWRYSRHPNYFFEFLTWVGFAIGASNAPYGWIAVICPAMILYLLLRVTGIPLTEEFSLRSKGDAYREYQRTTSPFIPWPPRDHATARQPRRDLREDETPPF